MVVEPELKTSRLEAVQTNEWSSRLTKEEHRLFDLIREHKYPLPKEIYCNTHKRSRSLMKRVVLEGQQSVIQYGSLCCSCPIEQQVQPLEDFENCLKASRS